MGLPKNHRLRHRSDFSRVYQKGKRFKAAHLTLRALRRRDPVSISTKRLLSTSSNPLDTHQLDANHQSVAQPPPTRIGISISTKVDKRSVVRNRIRRQIQAIFRHFLPRMSPSWDLLVTAHPEAVQCDYLQFLQELEQLLIDAEVIDGNPGECVL